MARHHVYLSRSLEARIDELRATQAVSVSKLARLGIEMALDKLLGPMSSGPVEVPQIVAPEPAQVVEVAPASAPEQVQQAPAIRMWGNGDSVRFDFGDVCKHLDVDPVDAYPDLPEPPVMYDGRSGVDLDGLLAVCSMSARFDAADRLRSWAEVQAKEVPV